MATVIFPNLDDFSPSFSFHAPVEGFVFPIGSLIFCTGEIHGKNGHSESPSDIERYSTIFIFDLPMRIRYIYTCTYFTFSIVSHSVFVVVY